ncbi:D-aminoacyl-tRNA deacylase [Psychrobacter sp. DM4]|uniref:D-aminoacyl-tRNA deacylase n=1 Tax=Psychrobacter sp. DM4 TaxID=3440637 RepID=UPI003F4FE293
MRALIQRVSTASVAVDGETIGAIEQGVLAYIGLGHEDTIEHGRRLIDKILTYRIFENESHQLDQNVQQVNGGLLLVSQFTLMAKTNKGRRPDFGAAMTPDKAQILFAEMVSYAQSRYLDVATGQFGADMQVASINDGPLNFLLEVV